MRNQRAFSSVFPLPRLSSLFFKIFLWFWIAMTVAGTILLALEAARTRKLTERWRGVINDAFAVYAITSAEAAETKDDPPSRRGQKLKRYLQDLEKSARIRARLFDEDGREVFGHLRPTKDSRWLTARMRELAARARRSGQTEFAPVSESTLVARLAVVPSGRRYILVGEMPTARYGPWVVDPRIQALRLLAVLLIAGIVSWGLARHLTAPIETLRTATRRLASGDLSARAGTNLGEHQDELSELRRDFDHMAVRIENLLHEQERLVGVQRRLLRDVSHELRSPLARLGVALDLARDRIDDMEAAIRNGAGALTMPRSGSTSATEALDRIEHEAGQLREMIDRLLLLSRLESGVQGPDTTPVDLAALVRKVSGDADFEAQPQRRVVSLTICDDCITSGTYDLLHSAIENVVRNAVHYTPEETTVEVSLRQVGEQAVITVRDQGPGVPEGELGAVFEPFHRAGNSRDRHSGGTGLGLAITQRAVQLHGGTVTARNAPEHSEGVGGLSVEIRLPLRKDQE